MTFSSFSLFIGFIGTFTLLSVLLLFSPIRPPPPTSTTLKSMNSDQRNNNNNNNNSPDEDVTTASSAIDSPQSSIEVPVITTNVPPSEEPTKRKSNDFYKIDHTKDQLPTLDKQMRDRIRKGHEIIKKIDPVDVLLVTEGGDSNSNTVKLGPSEANPVKVEIISNEEIFGWTKNLRRGKETTRDSFIDYEEDSSSSSSSSSSLKTFSPRVKFVRTFSRMMELFPEGKDDEKFKVNTSTYFAYARPYLRWKLSEHQNNRKTRFACLYAGFMRDFANQLRGCYGKRRCSNKNNKRNYGYQFDRIIKPLDCDVFISSWNLHGAGRYFTTDYDENALILPPQFWLSKLGGYLAAMHVHNFAPYQELWHSAHRFPRNFPQIRVRPESAAEAMLRKREASRMFGTYNNDHKYIRLNDYSQSFKHYCSMLLTWSYETWARGSYDMYLRLRTDERAIRWFVSNSIVTWKKIAKNENNSAPTSKDIMMLIDMKFAAVETCPPDVLPPSMKTKRQPQEGIASSSGSSSSSSSGAAPTTTAAAETAADSDGTTSDTGGLPTSFMSCSSHLLSSSITAPHLNRSFDSLFSIFKKDFASKQRIAINAMDIADFAYLGSPEIISYFGAHIWNFCTQESSSVQPGFSSGVVQLQSDQVKFEFSEYNLMLWRMILDAGWKKDSLNNMVRVSRGTMKKV